MLGAARRVMTPSARSDVPAFMVMDVMAPAARIEAAGGRVVHMEVGQPAAPAPRTAIAAAKAALDTGDIGYTAALGIPARRACCAGPRRADHGHTRGREGRGRGGGGLWSRPLPLVCFFFFVFFFALF